MRGSDGAGGGLTLAGLQDLFAHGTTDAADGMVNAPAGDLGRGVGAGVAAGVSAGVEVGAVKKTIFASPSRVKDMLAYLRLQGLISNAAPNKDRRVRMLAPTDLLTNIFSDWILGYLRGSAVLLAPPTPLSPGAISSDTTHTLFSYRVRAYLQDGFTTNERFASVRRFMMRSHGYSTFLRLM